MENDQTQNKIALISIAHPDDAEFGAAGTAALWVQEGWDVYLVVCTDGSGGGDANATEVGPEARHAISETRKREQRAAAEVLGLKDVIFLDYTDGSLQPTLALRRDLVRVLRKYRPTRVICQSPERTWTPTLALGRYHPDHLAAGQATIEAIYPASQNAWEFPELLKEGLLPHKVREIYIMGAPNPNFAVDVSPTIEKKLAALEQHVSQHINNPKMEEFLRKRSADTGAQYGMAYAEVFHRTEN